MAKRKDITCIKYNDANNYGWVTHSTAREAINDGEAVEWNPYENEPEHAEKPTMDSLKKDIIAYLVENEIEHDPKSTKPELLELI